MEQSPAQFYAACQREVAAFIDQAAALFPQAQPSHLCIRSANDDDFALVKQFAFTLGDLVTPPPFKGKVIHWVKLRDPLTKGARQIDWLELTPPDPAQDFTTGVQKITFAEAGAETQEIILRQTPNLVARRQANSARMIVG